jgi:hypothetical protein
VVIKEISSREIERVSKEDRRAEMKTGHQKPADNSKGTINSSAEIQTSNSGLISKTGRHKTGNSKTQITGLIIQKIKNHKT